MPPKPTPPRKPKASGANIEEWQRRGLKIQFRISEAEAREVQARATKAGLTANAYVRGLLEQELAGW